MEQIYTFNTFGRFASDGIFQALISCNPLNKPPIFICVGSDLVLGDSLGPLVGTFLKSKNARSFIYGTLNYPITAKEVDYARLYLKQMHPNSIAIAIDAAVGKEEDVGLIRVIDKGLKPGLGVNKKLGEVGDAGIIGVVAKKVDKNFNLYNLTRLNLVYSMAETISNGIDKYIRYLLDKKLITA